MCAIWLGNWLMVVSKDGGDMQSKIIVALDFNDLEELKHFINTINPADCRVKVGKELFTAYGPTIVRELQLLGFEVFLDLKFHDIPNTVYKAIKVAASLGVWMVDVHASGGREMLKAAKRAIDDSQHKPLLIAVTVLTSLATDDLREIGYTREVGEQVLALARLSHACKLDGVVCSAHEAKLIKAEVAADFLTITPGIRLDDNSSNDQTRIMTPINAISNGADYLVIGRPVTMAKDPVATLHEINHQLAAI